MQSAKNFIMWKDFIHHKATQTAIDITWIQFGLNILTIHILYR